MSGSENVEDPIEGRPVVLVVEDEEDALEWRTESLQAVDCMAIGVRSHDEAMRELRAGPAIDLVLTDIRLTPQINKDKSGVALARYIKETYVDLPVAGYSARFHDTELESEKKYFDELFDIVWPKGETRLRELDEIIDYCRRRALEHRKSRRETAFELHAVLRRRHEEKHPEVELMRELHPTDQSAPIEAALRAAGYRLKLVEARNERRLSKPIIVWLLEVDGQVEAEVYGQPALYAHGDSDEEAIAALVDLMRLYAEECDVPEEAIGPALSLTKFLAKVLAANKSA